MTAEVDADSLTSTPRSGHQPPPSYRWHPEDSAAASGGGGGNRVRFMCSFGGRILPRPHDHQLRYVGGDTRILAVPRSISFSTLLLQLSKIAGVSASIDQLSVKCQLPNEDLDALISLSSDKDVENMMDEYDRLSLSYSGGAASRNPRLRIFLFPPGGLTVEDTGAVGSILDGCSSKRDDWFLDALNGSGDAAALERGHSEASSIVSEVPDYLFGLDNASNEQPSSAASPAAPPMTLPVQENLSPSGPAISDIQPVRTKPLDDQAAEPPNPVWPYLAAEHVRVYYVPGTVVPGGSLPVQPVPMPYEYAHQVAGGQVSTGFGQPVQVVLGNPVHVAPVYLGGKPVMSAAYEYSVQPKPVAADACALVAAGGLTRNPMVLPVLPVFPDAGIAPPGGEPHLPVVSDMRTDRAS